MELKITFQLSQLVLPKDYLPIFNSFLKNTLQENSPHNYQELFGKKDAKIKDYTFYIKLSNPIFKQNYIEVDNPQVVMSIRSINDVEILEFYNAFLQSFYQKKIYPMQLNSAQIQFIKVLPLKSVENNTLFIKMLSPLVVKKHSQKNNADNYYYCFEDEEFESVLKENVKNVCTGLGYQFDFSNFKIIPVNPKRTVLTLYGISFPVSLGSFILRGNKELLNFLYQSGLSCIRSSGCGAFTILGKE